MRKKLKQWLFKKFEYLIPVLYDLLEQEKNYREKLKQQARQLRLDEEQRKIAEIKQRETIRNQNRCLHLKGGSGIRGTNIDYAISDHTFPDGSRYVRCLICSRIWRGDELNSPEVLRMLGRTTNTRTASEFPISTPYKQMLVVFHDSVNYGIAPNNDDEEWRNNPLFPWMGRKWIPYWDKLLKKFNRKKKKVTSGPNSIS